MAIKKKAHKIMDKEKNNVFDSFSFSAKTIRNTDALIQKIGRKKDVLEKYSTKLNNKLKALGYQHDLAETDIYRERERVLKVIDRMHDNIDRLTEFKNKVINSSKELKIEDNNEEEAQ